MDQNRMAGILISGECLASFIRNGERHFKVDSPVPDTAVFSHAMFDQQRNCFTAFFRDESFAVVGEGAVIPILEDLPTITELELVK